jgi:hypothetical protein
MDREHLLACATAAKRNSAHWQNTTVTWGELLDWLSLPDNVKECGNYVLGTLNPTTVKHGPNAEPCTNLHRNKMAIIRRGALTLDLDSPAPNFPELVEMTLPYAYAMHTTFSHSPGAPRYRLIIPLDREVSPDEYVAAAEAVMQLLGHDNFDPGSSQPERYMFKPSTPNPAEYESHVQDGPPATADDLLADFDPDLSHMPLPGPSRGKRNPDDLAGVVGAFNRAYQDWQELITQYELPYEPAGAGRWALAGARSVAGMGIVGDTGFVYSHHVTDPAYGEVRSAFDLVRVHMFSNLDAEAEPGTPINKLPSYKAMEELASIDFNVTAEMVGDDFKDEMGQILEGSEWVTDLQRTRNGVLKDVEFNWNLLREKDPVLRSVFFNQMTQAEEFDPLPPWRSGGSPQVTKTDVSEFMFYVERLYGNGYRPPRGTAEAVIEGAAKRRNLHPVEEYLKSLEWDGEARLEECLPCAPTAYSRMVARKCLVAAVARVFEPGVKWDHTLIFHGPEGLGKTWWMEQMSKGWTAPVVNVNDKDTLINLQRSWIATSDEGGSMRKADMEALKEFLTRRVDVFRAPYDRTAVEHPRRCVVWGTTNDDVFLRRQEGNRRFLIVKVQERVDFNRMTDEYVDQLWAEAVHLYRQGEVLLFLSEEESAMAEKERSAFVEEGDGLEGIISHWLNSPVPEDWDFMSIAKRQDWQVNREFYSPATGRLDVVCGPQIWVEALGREAGTYHRNDLLNIGKAMRSLGWEPSQEKVHVPQYGPHNAYIRPDLDELDDLL